MASNHLDNETSPYLLQHADNPVNWYPWGQEALNLAKSEDKPILLSIGYSACHWCHVMAHESFEDPATAELMNQWFINIKVDREERPDLDSLYMSAVTSMTGHGGWPMTVFLTPDGKPFYCGTYFPPQPRHGMPAFRQVLSGVAEAWQERQENVRNSADEVARHLRQGAVLPEPGNLEAGALKKAVRDLAGRFDRQWGGFGSAPKFPQPMVLEFLLRQHLGTGEPLARDMLTLTLQKMAEGGMYDHLGGGFARYSTDARWLVPHFEKMLYDNAQLARIYLRTFQVTGDGLYRCIAEQTLDYALREMRHPEGGFYSSQDADSEGEEGKFFVWSASEVSRILGRDADLFMRAYGVSGPGNWEGKNILHRAQSTAVLSSATGLVGSEIEAVLSRSREKLLRHRSARVWPGLDDKVLTSWNGLMLSALAEAGRVLGRGDYLAAAIANAEFLRKWMCADDGRLLRTWKAGAAARLNGYLEDYSFLAEGLLSLYEATFDHRWFAWAMELAKCMLEHFADRDQAGFFDTSDDHEKLIVRPRDIQDNAMPSGNARAAMVLFRLGLYAGDKAFLQAAEASLAAAWEMMVRYPAAFGEWLNVASFISGRPRELALVGPLEKLDALRAVVNETYRPDLVVAAGEGGEIPLLAGRRMVSGTPTAYLCERFSCQAPVSDAASLRSLLAEP